jgi:sn-glycerol 3-phosphate transport system ATP-binding protein
MAQISLQHLTRSYDGKLRAGLFDCNLEVHDGEICTVVGPSGAGKSTMLRLIAGLEAPESGNICIGGRDVTHLRPNERDIGLLSQRPALYPHLNVRRNLSIGLEMRRSGRVDSKEIQRRVSEAIELLGLTSITERRPERLSGGEQQRVALGRLMVRRPSVWLLDEPLNHLDTARKNEFCKHLHLLRGQFPTTIIFVTHDPVEALTLGQRLAVMGNGQLHQTGSPVDVYARPADRFVAAFLGWPPLNLAEGTLVRSQESGEGFRFAAADGSFHLPVSAELVTHGAGGQPVAVGIRPEHLELKPAASPPLTDEKRVLPAWRVVRAEFASPQWLVTVKRGRWIWMAWSHESLPAGDMVDLVLLARCLHWFDGSSGNRIEPQIDADQAPEARH